MVIHLRLAEYAINFAPLGGFECVFGIFLDNLFYHGEQSKHLASHVCFLRLRKKSSEYHPEENRVTLLR